MATDEGKPQLTFAAMQWPKRWNNADKTAAAAMLTDISSNTKMLTTCLGWVMYDAEDAPHLLRQLEAAVKLLKENL